MYARARQASNLSLTRNAPTTKSSEAGPLARARHTIGNQAALRGNASDGLPVAHDLPRITFRPIYASKIAGATQPAGQRSDIPVDGNQPLIIDAPPTPAPAAGVTPPSPPPPVAAPKAPPPDPCGQPFLMMRVISGSFLGGLTMDDYYPDLKGRGYYDHPGTGGTFDTGTRVGGNAQLLGVIGNACTPANFHLEQTVTRARYRINGSVHPEEGKTFDDIAKSGRDFSKAPSRQEFAGGAAVPLGYVISMADPPSTGYGSSDTIDHDRTFVTSLVGPSGRQSINWAVSTRIVNGTVTSNTMS